MFYTLVSRTVITKINSPRDYLYIFLLGSVGYVVLHWYLHMDKREGFTEKIREYLYYAMVIDAITAYVLMVMYPSKSSDKKNDKTDDNEESKEKEYTPEQKKAILQRMQEARRFQQMRQRALAEQEGKRTTGLPVLNQNQSKEQSATPATNESKETKNAKNTNDVCDAKVSNNEKEKEKDKEANESVRRSIFTKSEESRETTETNSNEGEQQQNDNKVNDAQQSKNKTETNKTKSDPKVECPGATQRVKASKKDSERVDTDIPFFEGNNQKNEKKAKKSEK
jgi:hypothetical protein